MKLQSLFQRFLLWLQSRWTRSYSVLSSQMHFCVHKTKLFINLRIYRIWIHQDLRTLILTSVPEFCSSYTSGRSSLGDSLFVVWLTKSNQDGHTEVLSSSGPKIVIIYKHAFQTVCLLLKCRIPRRYRNGLKKYAYFSYLTM